MLEKDTQKKNAKASASTAAATQDPVQNAASVPNKPRRKPRKLNKDPSSASAQNVATPAKTSTEVTDGAASAELEALKSRVRGLEAKVEQLYSGAETKGARSPRRRGKGRKASSSTQVPTMSSVTKTQEHGDNEEEADEELVRLEGELEVARKDLESYRPRTHRTKSQRSDEIEEIPRERTGQEDEGESANNTNRHVTLSGSYRIPLPTNVSMEDVKTIQSGVSAAQNVARSFFEQRRAASALREQQNDPPTSSRAAKPPTPRTLSSSVEVAVAPDGEGGKQSWSEWVGGYSMAITRAVKNIEHEAFMETQQAGTSDGHGATTLTQSGRNGNANPPTATKKGGRKRPAAKAKMSSEQVQKLMS